MTRDRLIALLTKVEDADYNEDGWACGACRRPHPSQTGIPFPHLPDCELKAAIDWLERPTDTGELWRAMADAGAYIEGKQDFSWRRAAEAARAFIEREGGGPGCAGRCDECHESCEVAGPVR